MRKLLITVPLKLASLPTSYTPMEATPLASGAELTTLVFVRLVGACCSGEQRTQRLSCIGFMAKLQPLPPPCVWRLSHQGYTDRSLWHFI